MGGCSGDWCGSTRLVRVSGWDWSPIQQSQATSQPLALY